MSTCVCDWDPAEAYCKTTVVARKRHSCSECFGWIEPGESYERVWGKWDGSQDTFKTCPDCLALRDWTKAHVPCFCWQHGSLRDDAREVITDVCERNDVPGFRHEPSDHRS